MPPSPPSKISAPALHRPPWLARVSAATSSPATARPAGGGSSIGVSQITMARMGRRRRQEGDGHVLLEEAEEQGRAQPAALSSSRGRGRRGLLLCFHHDHGRFSQDGTVQVTTNILSVTE